MAARGEDFSNWRVIGHEWAVRGLARSLASDRVAHAYLFTGPHGIGKTTLARALAQALECTGAHPPCGECRSCQNIAHARHPDVLMVEGVPPRYDFEQDSAPPPRSNDRERRALRIRQIRDLERDISRSPFEGRWKLAILRRFEEAEEPAANAFLKTLEEPPARARLLLTARDTSLVLPTIASRCQVVPLRPLPIETVERALRERWLVDPTLARLLARLSGGRLGWAMRASADPKMLEARRTCLDELTEALCEGRAERLLRADHIAKDAERLPELLEYWLGWWRDLLLLQSGDGDRITNVDREDRLREQAAHLSLAQILKALKAVRDTAHFLSQNSNARLSVDVLLLHLPQLVI